MREKIIYLNPEEELTNVREHLEKTKSGSIILVIPPQTQLRSHVGWRLLHSRTRELGQDVLIISSDRQIQAVAKAAGFRVADSLESRPSDRPRTTNRPVRRDRDGKSSQGTNKQASSGKKVTRSLPSDQEQMPLPTSENSRNVSNSGDVKREIDPAAASTFEIEDIPYDSHYDLPLETVPSRQSDAGDQEDGEVDSLAEDYYVARSIREAAQDVERSQLSSTIESTETSSDTVEQSSKNPQPSEIEDDPLGYLEDIQPTALPEQRASTIIQDSDQGVPDISDVPTDVYEAEVEDLGDAGGGLLHDDWPSYESDDQVPEKSEVQRYHMPPRSSRTGNTLRPSFEDLENEDELLPPLSPIPNQTTRSTPSPPVHTSGATTPSTAARREPQPIIQPSSQARKVTVNPTTQQTKKPVTMKKSRVVTTPPSSGQKPITSPRPPGSGRRGGTRESTSRRLFIPLLVIAAILLILFFMLVGFATNILPGVVYSATATITPASRILKNTYEITGVVGIPDTSRRQIQVRLLSNTTTSQAKTIMVSGVGHVPATVARGSLTFYNALPYSQRIVFGTVSKDNNGVQVVNDKTAIIPAAKPPTEGSVTIPAHSIAIGTKGNIPAFDFNDVPCCVAGITIQNQAKFSGGQDQRDYTYVQQSDIDGIVNAEKVSLIQQAKSALQAEFFQNEQLVNPEQCTSDSISDHLAGDKATSVTVALTVTCTGEVFDRQEAQFMAANLLISQAMIDPGAGYSLVGGIATTIKQIVLNDVNKGTIILFVSAEGIWANQLSDSSKRILAELIAGKKSTDAQSLLLHHVGIAKADIQVSGIFANMLPDDPGRITIVIQSVHGL